MGVIAKYLKQQREESNNSKDYTNEELLEMGVCPNCWGRQKYDDKFVEFVKDRTKSEINKEHRHRKAFIEKFIETEISGVKLKETDHYQVCGKCKSGYRKI